MRLLLSIKDLNERLTYWDTIPAMIKQASEDSFAAKKSIEVLETAIREREYEIQFEVDTDRATYKTKELRDARKAQLASGDAGIVRRRREIADYEKIKMIADRQMWQLKDEAAMIKAQIQASVAVITALAGTDKMKEMLNA